MREPGKEKRPSEVFECGPTLCIRIGGRTSKDDIQQAGKGDRDMWPRGFIRQNAKIKRKASHGRSTLQKTV